VFGQAMTEPIGIHRGGAPLRSWSILAAQVGSREIHFRCAA